MLLSFTVKNFKSFKNEVTVNFDIGNSKSKSNHINKDGSLKAISIFGTNSSGKSNLIQALKTYKKIVTDPYYTTKDPIQSWNSNCDETYFSLKFCYDEEIYEHEIIVIPHGKKLDQITKQSFSYTISSEKIYHTDNSILVFEKNIQNIDNFENTEWNYLLKENSIIKNKLSKIIEEKNTIQYDIDTLNDIIKDYSLEYADLLKNKNSQEHQHYLDIKDKIKAKRKKLRNIMDEISKIDLTLDNNRDKIEECEINRSKYHSVLITKNNGSLKGVAITKNSFNKIINNMFQWITSGLIIVETDGYHIPINQTSLLDNLSDIVYSMDMGISKLQWNKIIDKDKISHLDYEISEYDHKRISICKECSLMSSSNNSIVVKTNSGLYLLNFWMGDTEIFELVSIHGNNKQHFKKFKTESDGTRRFVELSSILLPNSSNKVFIVDELDRKLHPLLTLRLIKMFLNDNYEKQLIFTTHESRLFTTDILRMDEIKLVDKMDGVSTIIPLDEIKIEKKKRLEVLYLDDKTLPGIPKIQIE